MPTDNDIVLRHRFMQSLDTTENRYLRDPKKDRLWQETYQIKARSHLSIAKDLLEQHRSRLEQLKNVNYSENDQIQSHDVQEEFTKHEAAVTERSKFLDAVEKESKSWKLEFEACETVSDWNRLLIHPVHGLLNSAGLKNQEFMLLGDIKRKNVKRENVRINQEQFVQKTGITAPRDKEFMDDFIDAISEFESRNGVLDISFGKEIEKEMEKIVEKLENLDVKTNVHNIKGLKGILKTTARNDLANRSKSVLSQAKIYKHTIGDVDIIGDSRNLENLSADITEIIQWCQNVSSDIKESTKLQSGGGKGLQVIETDIFYRKNQLVTIQLV